MANYILTNKAVEDLSQIWNYTCEVWSETQADKYYLMMIDNFENLASRRIAGKKYDEINLEIFGIKAGKHIIFYREMEAGIIEVIRILHERINLKSRIQE